MNDFDEIYKAYYKQIYFYLLDLSKNKDIAEEITQETFFKVLNKIGTFKGDSKISSWITEIAKNTYFSYLKKHKREAVLDTESIDETTSSQDTSSTAEQDFMDKLLSKEIHTVLHKLNEPYKEVFWMRVFGELSFKEIGSIHGKTENWARVTYHRAKLLIKQKLEEK